MQRMSEADIYNRLTKDGDSLPTIKKNTEMLRQEFTIESQRVAHTLSQLDPNNKDRHEAEAQRIYQENNAALDRVLMQIASTTPQKMPSTIEAINRASKAANVPKNQAKAVLSMPVILFAAFVSALFYEFVFVFGVAIIGVVAALIGHFIFKIDTSGLLSSFWGPDSKSTLILLLKLIYGICYVIAVVVGFRHLRKGGTLGEAFEMLFWEPLIYLMSLFGGGK